MENPKFTIFLGDGGEFRFRLRAANGEIILKSESYTAKQSMETGIEAVKKSRRKLRWRI